MDKALDYILGLPGYLWGSLLIALIMIVAGFFIKRSVNKLKVGDRPGKFLTLIIFYVEFMNNYIKKGVGKHWKTLAPVLVTLGAYMFFLNISGLILIDTPTKYTTITASFAVISVLMVQVMGFKSKKLRHFGTLVGPVKWLSPLMVPLNLLSDFTPILSMTLRLFGSIASGSALISLIYGLTSWASIIVAPIFHVIFDLGFGLLQVVVYVLLTVIFASNKVYDSDIVENV